jgi:hypothetical protein
MLLTFIVLLILSGVTAFPIETELRWIGDHSSFLPDYMQQWLFRIRDSVISTNQNYPQLSYGTDWLAFAHLVIATAFIGPLRDPVRNVWVIHFGIISCLMVFPLALIAGPIRQIPFYWQMIDCSFGLLGLIPLIIVNNYTKRLEQLPA